MEVLIYLMKVLFTTSSLYVVFHVLKRKEGNFQMLRYLLLLGLILCVVVPALPLYHTIIVDVQHTEIIDQEISANEILDVSQVKSFNETEGFTSTVLFVICVIVLGVFLMLFRLLKALFLIRKLHKNASLENRDGYKLVVCNESLYAFSIWKTIYLSHKLSGQEKEFIIKHELVHVSQYHSVDVLIVELLLAFQWFNPFMWLIKKELQQIHEYIADQEVLDSGVETSDYKQILIDRVAQESLISFVSAFSYVSIKKRFEMMKKEKSKRNLNKLMILPVMGVLFAGVFAYANPVEVPNFSSEENKSELNTGLSIVENENQKDEELNAIIALTRMNVLYVGLYNPLSVYIPGYKNSEVIVSITNGSIKRGNKEGEYFLLPRRLGMSVLKVEVDKNGKKELVQKVEYRVKRVPDPVAMLDWKTGGQISIDDLGRVTELKTALQNFDFDFKFEVKGFVLSAVKDGYTHEAASKSNEFTKEQKEIFMKLSAGDKIFISEIQASGQDGRLRDLSPMKFTVK